MSRGGLVCGVSESQERLHLSRAADLKVPLFHWGCQKSILFSQSLSLSLSLWATDQSSVNGTTQPPIQVDSNYNVFYTVNPTDFHMASSDLLCVSVTTSSQSFDCIYTAYEELEEMWKTHTDASCRVHMLLGGWDNWEFSYKFWSYRAYLESACRCLITPIMLSPFLSDLGYK